MARTIDPHSWPFAVPRGHPSQVVFWGAMLIYATNLIVLLSGREGLPTWSLAVAVALQLISAVWARAANAKARREDQHAVAHWGPLQE